MENYSMMETISFPIFARNAIKKQTLFSVNDIQVIFNTDAKTADKLEDDEVLKDYLRAVIQANLLAAHGILDTTQITSIERLDACDGDKVIVALDIATNVQQGVEELRCCVTQDSIVSEIEVPSNSEDFAWNQQVPEVTAGPTLRWNSEMTTLLIRIRGDMDREFNRAKYKFRLWEKVATKLNTLLLHVRVTAKDCDDKWRNIVATYRKNIDKIKCYGDNSVRWEYFNAMDNILKGTKELSDPLNENNSPEQMAKLISELNQPEVVRIDNEGVEVVDISASHSDDEDVFVDEEDDSPQNSIITRKSTGEKRKWTTEMCLLLLYLRYQADNKFRESYENTFYLWKDLASQMNDKFMTDFSANEVESVWNHCVINYEINLENLKAKGVNTVKWKYFAVMDELLGGTSEIADICVPRPGENLLKEFNKLQMKNDIFTDSMLIDADTLCYSNNAADPLKDESDSEDNVFTLSGTLWTKDMVKTLIFLKKQINEEIASNRISRKRQWMVMVRRFRTLKNIKVTEEACEEKWKNLLRTYKKNLIRVKNRGSTVKWPFFWKMREIVGNSVLLDEKRSYSFDNRSKSTDLRQRSSLINDDSVDNLEEVLNDSIHEQLDNLYTAVNEVRQNQTKILLEIVDKQNKAIQEMQQEQLNIKCLLTQLLQKFT